MAVSDLEYIDWLSDDGADPVVLIEADYVQEGTPGTVYVANAVYPGPGGDPTAVRIYDELIDSDITIDSRIDRQTVGDVRLVNDGEITPWLGWVWRGHPIKFYLGDRSWPRSDFRLQIDAINGGIRSVRSNQLSWRIYDLSQTLRVEIASESAPLLLGKVFNARPVVADAVAKVYKINDGPVVSIDMVRDNGVDITGTVTLDLANGEFTLGSANAGEITVDATQADQSAADMIEKICGDNGISVNSTNLAAYPNTKVLGYYTDRPVTIESVVREVTESVGGAHRFNTSRELEVWRFEPPGAVTTTLSSDVVVENGLTQSQVDYPSTKITIGYKRNWSVQSPDSLSSALSIQLRSDYSTDYQLVEATNTLTDYPLAKEVRKNSLFFNEVDAQEEADRRAVLRSAKRTTERSKCFLSAAAVFEGEAINLTYPGLGYESGKDVRVVGIRRILGRRRFEMTLWS